MRPKNPARLPLGEMLYANKALFGLKVSPAGQPANNSPQHHEINRHPHAHQRQKHRQYHRIP